MLPAAARDYDAGVMRAPLRPRFAGGLVVLALAWAAAPARAADPAASGKPFLEDVDLPALSPPGIGIMVWDKDTGIARIRVERLK